jgi:hypothetical protein
MAAATAGGPILHEKARADQARATSILGGADVQSNSGLDWRAQLLVDRYRISTYTAVEYSRSMFGENFDA